MSEPQRQPGSRRRSQTDDYLFEMMSYAASKMVNEEGFNVPAVPDIKEESTRIPLTFELKLGFYAKFITHWAVFNSKPNRHLSNFNFTPSEIELEEAAKRYIAPFLGDDAGGAVVLKKDESDVSGSDSKCEPVHLIAVLRLIDKLPSWVDELVSEEDEKMSLEDVQGLTRQTAWLLPTNRKIRHLQKISLREVTFNDRHNHAALCEDPARMEHSKSSGDLKAVSGQYGSSIKPGSVVQTDGSVATRPSYTTMRRKSTHNWGTTTPDIRQKKLEDVINDKLPETFVAMYPIGSNHPIYISETITKSMNPDFGLIDMSKQEPWITRLDEVVINVWARTDNMNQYEHLIQASVHLSSLQWLGKSLTDFRNPLPANTIIWHLTDGVYALFTDHLPMKKQIAETAAAIPLSRPLTPLTPGTPRVQNTSSFDSLMRLKNIDECIRDAIATRQGIIDTSNSFLHDSDPSGSIFTTLTARQEMLAATKSSITIVQREIDAKERKKVGLEAENTKRRALMARGKAAQMEKLKLCPEENDLLLKVKENLKSLGGQLQGQVRRIAEELSSLFPIEPIDGKPLNFTVRGVCFPNADELSPAAMQRASITDSEVAYALDLVCYIIEGLAFALEYLLPYPLEQCASRSSICDPISITPFNGKRQFPLYQTGVPFAEFEYAVYLLNSDIAGLMQTQNLRMVNPKTTLANLKYLLAVLGSGEGEIPQRKAGRNKTLDAGVNDITTGIQHVNIGGEIIASDPASMEMGVPEVGAVINGRPKDTGKQRATQDMPTVKSIGRYTHYINYNTKSAVAPEKNGNVPQVFNQK